MTLAELAAMAEAKAKLQKSRDEFALYCVWQTAGLGRVKDFPRDFQKWLHPPKPITQDELAEARKRMAALPAKL